MKKSLRAKAFSLILLFAFILSFFAIFVSYSVHKNSTQIHYRELTQILAFTESLMVNPAQMEAYAIRTREIYDAYTAEHGAPADLLSMTEEEQKAYCGLYSEIYEMDGYAEMQESLVKLCTGTDTMYMYITLWDVENDNIIYLMDGACDGEPAPIGWVEPIEEVNREKIHSGDDNLPAYITNTPEYGWLCTATERICSAGSDRVIAYANADTSMDEVMKTCRKYLFNITLMLAVITLILMPMCLFSVDKVIVQPIKRIARAAYIFVSARKTNESIFGDLRVQSDDEIGRLLSSMQTMETEINDYISNLRAITAEKERVSAELSIATQIQADMLPSIFPAFPGNPEFDIYATMDPAKEVGGDFYDFFFVDKTHLAMVMADVSGKGVPAALFMVITKTLIKNRAQAGGSPAQVLSDVNSMLCENNKAMLFVTVWLAIVDITTGNGIAANAGHENPIIRRAGGEYELIKYRHSPAVAAMEGIRFREHEFELFPGDSLFVYTDGVPEASNIASKLYGTDRMLAILNAHKGEPLNQILRAIKEDIDRFVGEAPQFDDITMLGFDYFGQGGAQS